jgi:general secretion pathway protein L
MLVLTIFMRWIDILAGMLLGWHEARRARHWLKVEQDRDQWIVRRMQGREEVYLGTVRAGAAMPVEIARAAQKCVVVLELSPAEIITRRMNVPARARDLLPGIVRNQIERLSPWRVGQAVHGFDVATAADAADLDVRVLVAPRALIDDACGCLDGLGLKVDRVVASGRVAGAAAPVTLWSRQADGSGDGLARARRMIGGLIIGVVGTSLAVSLWAFIAAASADSESEDVAARIAPLQRRIQGALSQQSIAALAPAERAWALKETSPVAVIVVEALSRALPDVSYLTDFNLDRATLRIVGLADDAPSLIAPLERSGHFKDVHFFAPTTRDSNGSRYVFHIEASVEPHPEISGD